MAELDLNLLRVLKVLLDVQNTHKAAEVLHLSQSSVSKSLNKLRDYFNDPLFVRDKYGLKPTLRAIELGKQLPAALEHLNRVIDNKQDFKPGDIDTVVTIAMNSFIFKWLGGSICNQIVAQAPNIELHLIHWGQESEADMIKGGIELGINYFSPYISKQIYQKNIYRDNFVCVVRKNHPIESEEIVASTFDKYRIASLMIPSWNYQQSKMQEAVKKINDHSKLQLRSTSMETLLEVVGDTDLIFPCPNKFALKLDQDKYRIVPISHDLPHVDGTVVFLTDKVRKEDRLIKWLTQEVKSLIDGETKKPTL